jgi:hypothetical protein
LRSATAPRGSWLDAAFAAISSNIGLVVADITALSLFRRYRSDRSGELCMDRGIDRPVLDLGACRILAKVVVTFPIPRRSDRSGNKATAAIRTDVAQNFTDTRSAKRALVGTDARFK